MNPNVLRALEEMLRRVLRSPEHGIDPARVAATTSQRVAARSARRHALWALLTALAFAVLLIGWYLGCSLP